MKIIVLVKQVPDTWGERHIDTASGLLDRTESGRVMDEINERALEVALKAKDADKNTEILLMCMGPPSAVEALRKGLSMGADSAVHIVDDAFVGSDAALTATALAAALKGWIYDVIIAGNESTDGRGGVIPAMLAEHLGHPLLSALNNVELSRGAVSGQRGTEYGTQQLHAPLPAVISITESSPDARFPNFKGIMTAKRKPLTTVTLAALGIEPAAARSVVAAVQERPARTAGIKVVDEGNAGVELAEFLVNSRLV